MTAAVDLLLVYNVLIAAYNVAIQGVDLHTTSEGIKHGVGKEDNERLAEVLNSDRPHAVKFWYLARIKILGTVCCAGIGVIAWCMPDLRAFLAVLQSMLAIYYTPVMVSNWRIYSRAR